MEVIDLNNYKEERYETAVALGNFDGIHIGHRCLINSMVEKAKELDLKSSVLLFKNHTKDILKDNMDLKLNIITSNDQKIKILKELGVEIVYTMNFNKNIMKLTGERFIEQIIIGSLNSKLVTVGFDYKFGYKATGDSHYLKKAGLDKGFYVDVIKPIYFEDNIVSSTAIRELIQSGNIKKANEFLANHYTIEGVVIHGKNRGTKLGYPTANIQMNENYILPKSGVYKTNTILNDKKYSSITNIGDNPTFKDNELKIETHILNFNEDIYGKAVNVEFVDFIRKDIKFNTVEELVKQIRMDIFMY